ncbi:MAG: hypothetical protein HKN31_03525 [Pricia sp.]|nr:hypothetical protein [Pricia sp.]
MTDIITDILEYGKKAHSNLYIELVLSGYLEPKMKAFNPYTTLFWLQSRS